MNSLLGPQRQHQTQPSLPQNPGMSNIMQMMQSFQGTPQQAQEQFCNQVAQMGWTPSQLNSFLDNVEQQGRMLGFMR